MLQRPGITLLSFVGCFALLPSLAVLLARAFGLDSGLTSGLVLVSCINGAQASNVCNYIARGDVALSVLMNTVQTLGAIVMTPLMIKLLLGTVVPINAVAVAKSCVKVRRRSCGAFELGGCASKLF